MPLSVGDKLGSYEILAPIGASGMGEVYRARATRMDGNAELRALRYRRRLFSDYANAGSFSRAE